MRGLKAVHMTSDNPQMESPQEYANYETLGEPETILVGKSGFVEVAHLCDARLGTVGSW